MSEEERRIITIYLITRLIVIIILCIGKKKVFDILFVCYFTYLVLVRICDVLFSLVGFFR